MNREKTSIIFIAIISIGVLGIFLPSCSEKMKDGMIIFTQVAEKGDNINFLTGNSWRYIPQARLVALDPDQPEGPINLISEGFFSACSPEISHDGKSLLFAAQKNQNDVWQIWEMNLKNSKIRKVISSKENCIDPSYLPGDRLVFSISVANDSLKAGHSLFTGNLDGSNIKRITYNPDTYFASKVLKDGRILTISRQVFPDTKDAVFMVMRPDGTKAELFYQGTNRSVLFSRGYETTNGEIVFIESEGGKGEHGDVISISYNRPLHSRENLTSEIQGDFNAVLPLKSGNLLVSYRKSNVDRYTLYEFDPVKKVLGKALYTDKGYDELDAVEVRVHGRPKKLPSEVDMEVKTGLLLCQDINVLDRRSKITESTHADKINIMGIDSSMGVVQAEKDGSFYLKIIADKPFQIQSLDKDGHVVQSCDWIWLRPNERRGCVGCHEDHELTPENKIPLSVKKPPAIVPVHLNKIVEKKISLE